jgi:hypothetical protein
MDWTDRSTQFLFSVFSMSFPRAGVPRSRDQRKFLFRLSETNFSAWRSVPTQQGDRLRSSIPRCRPAVHLLTTACKIQMALQASTFQCYPWQSCVQTSETMGMAEWDGSPDWDHHHLHSSGPSVHEQQQQQQPGERERFAPSVVLRIARLPLAPSSIMHAPRQSAARAPCPAQPEARGPCFPHVTLAAGGGGSGQPSPIFFPISFSGELHLRFFIGGKGNVPENINIK